MRRLWNHCNFRKCLIYVWLNFLKSQILCNKIWHQFIVTIKLFRGWNIDILWHWHHRTRCNMVVDSSKNNLDIKVGFKIVLNNIIFWGHFAITRCALGTEGGMYYKAFCNGNLLHRVVSWCVCLLLTLTPSRTLQVERG